jgi:hypothetical protein
MAEKPKNPTLTIQPAETPIPPPRDLGEHGRALWDRVQIEFRVEDAGGVELLMQCCAAADRADELAAIIDKDGAVVRGKTGPRSHPLLRDEIQNRAFVARCLQRLGLLDEPIGRIGHPTGRVWKDAN